MSKQNESKSKTTSDRSIPEQVIDSIENGKAPYKVANLISDEMGRKAGRLANLAANLYHKAELDRETVVQAVPELARHATHIHQIDVETCNEGESTERSVNRKGVVQRLQTYAQEELGAKFVYIQGDPRGFPAYLFFEPQIDRLINHTENFTPDDEAERVQQKREVEALTALKNDEELSDDQKKLALRLIDRNHQKGVGIPNTNSD